MGCLKGIYHIVCRCPSRSWCVDVKHCFDGIMCAATSHSPHPSLCPFHSVSQPPGNRCSYLIPAIECILLPVVCQRLAVVCFVFSGNK